MTDRRNIPGDVEAAVIGGGVTGLSLSWMLAEKGVDVVVLDDGRHAGSTANAGSLHVQMQSRFIRLYPEAAPAVEAALPVYVMAVREWSRLAETIGRPVGLDATGGLMVAETEEQLSFLAAKCDREKVLGLDVEMLDRTDLGRAAPYLGPAVIGAELCHHEGKVNPLLANQAIRAAAIEAGARCLDNVTVGALVRKGGLWEISAGGNVFWRRTCCHRRGSPVRLPGRASRHQTADALGASAHEHHGTGGPRSSDTLSSTPTG